MKIHKIGLGSILDRVRFERLILQHYSTTCNSSCQTVVFQAGNLSSSDLLTLGLLLLWIKKLRQSGKDVYFSLESTQNDQRQIRFKALLHRWRVMEALQNSGAFIVDPLQLPDKPPSVDTSQRAVVGLHFFSDPSDVGAFLDTTSAREPELFQDSAKLGIISSGSLRNIILRELLLNIFEHGSGISGFTAMAERASPLISPNSAHGIISASPYWEQEFLRTLKTDSYLEVIVADHGPGIPKTLGHNWTRDPERTTQNKTKELNIIEYAFGRYASCKAQPNEYLRVAIEKAEGGLLKTITGLYFVRDVVAQHHGLLAVRSGRSWLSWNFSKEHDPKPLTHKSDHRLRTLEYFEGCQYCLLLPLGVPNHSSIAATESAARTLFSFTNAEEAQKPEKNYYIGRDPYHIFLHSGKSHPHTVESEDEQLEKLASSLRFSYRNAKNDQVFTVLIPGDLNSKRSALVLLYILIDVQFSMKPIFLVALGESAAVIELAAKEVELFDSDLPLLIFTPNLNFFLAGGLPDERDFIAALFSPSFLKRRKEPLASIAGMPQRRLRHLVNLDEGRKEFHVRLSMATFEGALLAAINQWFQLWDQEPPQGIRHRGHFLLPFPSNAYCEFFWDIGEVIANRAKLDASILALAFRSLRANPDAIVALSSNAGILAKGTIDWLESQGHARVPVTIIENPHARFAFLTLATRSEKIRALYLTDVIGTAKVINAALGLEPKGSVIGVAAIIDAREESCGGTIITSGGEIAVSSLLAKPQKYFRDLPAAWSYTDIQTIDPLLHRPIANRPLELPPVIWGKDLDRSLRHCAASDALSCGHFSSGTRHFSTFVMTARLIDQHCDEIVGAILSEVGSASDKMPEGSGINVSCALYNEASEAAGALCAMIAEAKANCQAIPIPLDSKRSRSTPPQIKTIGTDVIVVEPAASTGDTARSLLAYAAQLKPRNIFLFVIAERMPEVDAWLLLNINILHGAHVETRRFISLASGSYRLEECPQCILLSEYEQTVLHVGSPDIAKFAKRRLECHAVVPISTFKDPSASANSSRRELLWAEAAMGSRFHSALNDLELRHNIALMVTPRHDASLHCCGAILAAAREVALFRPQDGMLREVMYPTLAQNIIVSSTMHLADDNIDATVRDACFVNLIEMTLSRRGGKFRWWEQVACTQDNIIGLLCELCRWSLAGKREEEDIKSAKRILLALEKRSKRPSSLSNKLADSFTATHMLLSYRAEPGSFGQAREGPSAAWQACSTLLKRHGHVAAALDSLQAAVSPHRSVAELREYYEASWVERVRWPIEEVLLPSLARLQQSGLPKVHSRSWPLDSTTLMQLRGRTTQVEQQFRKLLEADKGTRARVDFVRLLNEIQSLRNILLGDDSAFLALFRRLVLTSIGQISAHFYVVIELLGAKNIECQLELTDLPPKRGVFISQSDLLTCITAIARNIVDHAFPDSFAGKREAAIRCHHDSVSSYFFEFADNGVGTTGGTYVAASQDNGLVTVKRFADAYGADLKVEVLKPGYCVCLRCDLVDL